MILLTVLTVIMSGIALIAVLNWSKRTQELKAEREQAMQYRVYRIEMTQEVKGQSAKALKETLMLMPSLWTEKKCTAAIAEFVKGLNEHNPTELIYVQLFAKVSEPHFLHKLTITQASDSMTEENEHVFGFSRVFMNEHQRPHEWPELRVFKTTVKSGDELQRIYAAFPVEMSRSDAGKAIEAEWPGAAFGMEPVCVGRPKDLRTDDGAKVMQIYWRGIWQKAQVNLQA